MGDEMLSRVCELAFDVAKEGQAPAAMKNYLYLAQRPPRAYSVAQRALDEDETFRQRVAERATIDNVGEAGYLWLHRPEGWEHHFALLGDQPDERSGDRPPMPEPPVTSRPTPTPASAPTVDSIESELSSLRDLVDRLADERKNVRSSVSELEAELETRRAENLAMSTRLSALRNELDEVQTTEASVLAQRDEALQRVESLEARVSELEAELDEVRSTVEAAKGERDRATTELDEVRSALEAVSGERDRATTELDEVRSALEAASGERDRATAELDEVRSAVEAASGERDRATAELDEVRSALETASGERDRLSVELESVTAERDRSAAILAEQEAANTSELEELRSARAQLLDDNTELASRVVVAEQARVDLESELEEMSGKWQAVTRQLAVYSGVNDQLDSAVAERNQLRSQLADARERLATLRTTAASNNDQLVADLDGLEQAFTAPVTDEAPEASVPIVSEPEDAGAESDESPEPTVEEPTVEEPTVAETPVDDAAEADEAPVDEAEPEWSVEDADFEAPVDDVAEADEAPVEDEEPEASVDDAELEPPVDDAELVDVEPTAFGTGAVDETEAAHVAAEPEPEIEGGADEITETDADSADEGGRTRIVIPDHLQDEIDIARHVVKTPDVVLLIDGDGAASLGWPHLEVAARRSALVEYLGQLTADTGAAADVVFERPVGGEEALPVSRAVRVRIADLPVGESPLFASVIDGYPREWPIAVVTDQDVIAAGADAMQVTHLNNGQLLDLFLYLSTLDQ